MGRMQNSRIKCKLCSSKFKSARDLRRHVGIHSGQPPYHCKDCDHKFSTAWNFRNHLFLHVRRAELAKAKNRFVGVLRSSASDRQAVKRIRKKLYRCHNCPAKFTQAWKLRFHALKHVAAQGYECGACNKRFSHAWSLKRHAKNSGHNTRFKASASGQNVAANTRVKKLPTCTKSEDHYACRICNDKPSKFWNLRVGTLAQRRQHSYQCRKCCKKFRKAWNFRLVRRKAATESKRDAIVERSSIEKLQAPKSSAAAGSDLGDCAASPSVMDKNFSSENEPNGQNCGNEEQKTNESVKKYGEIFSGDEKLQKNVFLEEQNNTTACDEIKTSAVPSLVCGTSSTKLDC